MGEKQLAKNKQMRADIHNTWTKTTESGCFGCWGQWTPNKGCLWVYLFPAPVSRTPIVYSVLLSSVSVHHSLSDIWKSTTLVGQGVEVGQLLTMSLLYPSLLDKSIS